MPVRLRIGELVHQQGWTIKALAERAGVAYTTAHVLATGRALRIDLDTLDRICTALGVEPGDVFIRSPEPDATGQHQHEGGAASITVGVGPGREARRRNRRIADHG